MCMTVCLGVSLSVSLSLPPSVCVSACLSVCLCVSVSICVSHPLGQPMAVGRPGLLPYLSAAGVQRMCVIVHAWLATLLPTSLRRHSAEASTVWHAWGQHDSWCCMQVPA